MSLVRLRKLALILLIFLGITACVGGWGLMMNPSGEKVLLAPDLLKGTLFQDYFVPGIFLFGINFLPPAKKRPAKSMKKHNLSPLSSQFAEKVLIQLYQIT